VIAVLPENKSWKLTKEEILNTAKQIREKAGIR
jgi:hypothetical protein